VVLAVGLLAIVLTTSMELLSVGLRSARTSSDYTAAVLLAKRKLAEVWVTRPEGAFSDGGSEGSYRWRAEARPQEAGEDLPARLVNLKVTVAWPTRGGEKRLELTTLRLAPGETRVEAAGSPAAPTGAGGPGQGGPVPGPGRGGRGERPGP
jgi:hypothetical protein